MPKPVATGRQREQLASQVRAQRAQGRKQSQIARDFLVSPSTVSRLTSVEQKKRRSKS